MPARSKAQQHLFGAALGGATFPEAERLRASLTHQQLKDFAGTKTGSLPSYVKQHHSPHVSSSLQRAWPIGPGRPKGDV